MNGRLSLKRMQEKGARSMFKKDDIPTYDAGGRVERIEGYGKGGKVAKREGGEVAKRNWEAAQATPEGKAWKKRKDEAKKEMKNKKATSRATKPSKHKSKGKFKESKWMGEETGFKGMSSRAMNPRAHKSIHKFKGKTYDKGGKVTKEDLAKKAMGKKEVEYRMKKLRERSGGPDLGAPGHVTKRTKAKREQEMNIARFGEQPHQRKLKSWKGRGKTRSMKKRKAPKN
jgi:hypothetical protein